jgi:hypothetical protein
MMARVGDARWSFGPDGPKQNRVCASQVAVAPCCISLANGGTKMQQGAFAISDSVSVFRSTHPSRTYHAGKESFLFQIEKMQYLLNRCSDFLICLHQVVGKNVVNKMRSMKTIFGDFFFKYVIAT